MNGLEKDNYLVKFMVKWITAITDTEEKKMRLIITLQFSDTLPKTTEKNHVAYISCLLKSDQGFSEEGKG